MNYLFRTTHFTHLVAILALVIAFLTPQSALALRLKANCLGEAIKSSQIDRTKPIATYHGVYRPNGVKHWQSLYPLRELKHPKNQEAVLILRPKDSNICKKWNPVKKYWFGGGKLSKREDLDRAHTGLRIAFSISESKELIPNWLVKQGGKFKGVKLLEKLVKQGFDYVAIDELSGNSKDWLPKGAKERNRLTNLRNFRDFLWYLKKNRPDLAKRIILYVDTYKKNTAYAVAKNIVFQQIIGICANSCRIIASEVYSQPPCDPKRGCTERLARTLSRGGKKAIAQQTISVFTAASKYNGAFPDSAASIKQKYAALRNGKVSRLQPGAGAYSLHDITSNIRSTLIHARALRDANNKHAAFVLKKGIKSHGVTVPGPKPIPPAPLTMSEKYPTIALTIEHFYKHLLGRPADHNGREGFVRYAVTHPQGCGHVAYAAIVKAIAQSPEFNRRMPESVKGNKARRLTLLYRAALFREPDTNGWRSWADAYGRKGWKWSQIVSAFVSATKTSGTEFRNKISGRC